MAGCATDARQVPLTPETDRAKADFYWPYAALAADVYRTRGEVDTNIAMTLASPWLREEIERSKNQEASARFAKLGYPEAEMLYRQRLREECAMEQQAQPPVDQVSTDLTPSCQVEALTREREMQISSDAENEPNRFVAAEPASKDDCEYGRGRQPLVPIDTLFHEYKWSRVPELQKQTSIRGWSLFVPELAIDVWRRKRSNQGEPLVLEYAIVYRGTVGGGRLGVKLPWPDRHDAVRVGSVPASISDHPGAR